MTAEAHVSPGRLVARAVLTTFAVIVVVFGWRSMAGISVEAIAVHGAERASDESIVDLARIPLDSSMLTVRPALIADRVVRHPWVREAAVSRLPTGTVSIRVTERTPVLLVLDPRGEPDYYIDAEGFRMPYTAGPAWRVPVLRNPREAYHPVSPVRSRAVRELAAILPNVHPDVDALLSEFRVDTDGGLVLETAATPRGRTLTVRLGRSGLDERLTRLRAFWEQAVLARPDARFAWIDLRFDSQIVTNESS